MGAQFGARFTNLQLGVPYGCQLCCTIFSSVGVVLLLMFGAMFKYRNISLVVGGMMQTKAWDLDEKAKACFFAAGIYAAFVVVCGTFVYRKKSVAVSEKKGRNLSKLEIEEKVIGDGSTEADSLLTMRK